jgi:EAL domain-containing protein (putative c-di-GMP-specific phosphodiesterase class I)
LGVHVQLDDFGTGYSSLSYLTNFPVNALKIDQSFIRHMTDDSNNQKIVKTIIDLSQHLALESIAEGIETKEQVDQLKSLGCEYGQGYLLSVPLSQVDTEIMLKRISQGEGIYKA